MALLPGDAWKHETDARSVSVSKGWPVLQLPAKHSALSAGNTTAEQGGPVMARQVIVVPDNIPSEILVKQGIMGIESASSAG